MNKPISTGMKTKSLITLLFSIFFFSVFSQEQIIKLKLKEGHEYVFETTDKHFVLKEDNSEETSSVTEKKIRLFVEKFTPGQEAIISVNFLENNYDSPSSSDLINKVNLLYPDFTPDINIISSSTDYFDMFLCRSGIKFSIDLNSREIKVLNRVELLEEFFSFLRTQDLNERDVNYYVENTNKNLLPDQKRLVSHLIWFHNSKINTDGTVTNSLIKDKLKANKAGKEFLAFSDMDFENLISGKIYKKYWVEPDNGIVTHYTTIQRDSVNQNIISYNRLKLKWWVNETIFKLLYEKPVPINSLIISGEIEAPLSNIMHIKVLDKPCGVEMKTKTVLLNEKGYFKTSIDFSNGGFVYVENENKDKHFPPKTFVFYAEPGDTIGFEAKGEKQPWDVNFYGNRIEASKMIEEIRQKILVRNDNETISNFSRVIFDGDLSFNLNLINGKLYGVEILRGILKEIENAEKLASKNNQKIDERAINFILNETKSYIYCGLFQFFRSDWQRRIYTSVQLESGEMISRFIYDMQLPDFNELQKHLDQFNIQDIYNDYGIYSRKLVANYYQYQFSKTNKIGTKYISIGPIYIKDLENSIQFMRLILSGPALYREIGSLLKNTVLINDQQIYPRNEYTVNIALEKIELLSKRCNDMKLVSYLNDIVSEHKKLQNSNYLPEIILLNLAKKKVTFNDFSGEKPTLFCVSEGWGHYRYQFDDYAQKNPDINFVLVCENTSFDNWKDYTHRAEPIAKQLLYINDSTSINDLFQAPYVYFVLDKKGNMAGYARGTAAGIKKARATLVPVKKQLNKSQLKLIILVLGVVLTIFSLGFFLWKWRVRQRFRKEQQFRKLKELELTAIRSQMNPHFLFNCLNSVQNLIQQNKGSEAHLYLADFAGLIRKVLQNSEKEEVSLEEELEMTKQYLNLEKLRFDFDFNVSVENDIDANNTMVPSLLLQPFAENAIIHGLQNKSGNRRLNIEVDRMSDGIRIIIEDNGVGRKAAKQIAIEKNGKGSKLMKERLEILHQKHGEKYQLNIIDIEGNETGTKVEIIIPEEK